MYLKSIRRLWGTNRQLHKSIMILMARVIFDPCAKTKKLWDSEPLDPIRSSVRHNPPKKIKHKIFQNFNKFHNRQVHN